MERVSVSSNEDRLRLVFKPPGSTKRRFLYLGMADTQLNRAMAERIARQIEGDIVTGNFDSTLNKYKRPEERSSNTPILAIWDKYRDYKVLRVAPRFKGSYFK